MREAITFLMEMLFISITFFLGYKLIFHHSTPTFRRWYLLAWLTFSAAFPLITVDILVSSPISSASVGDFVLDSDTPLFLEPLSATTPMQDFGATESSMPVEEDRPKAAFNWKLLLATAYALVVIALLSRIVLGYLQIWRLKQNARSYTHESQKVFEVDHSSFRGASFFNWIFIGKSVKEKRALVLEHELVHSGLHHSFDILLSHLYCAFFWINPLAWILKKSIAINTELETDAHIIKNQDSTTYANLLLDLSQKSAGTSIMNHFSAKHLKMRIMEMKNITTRKRWVYYFTSVIVLGAFFFVSCSKVDLSNEISAEARLHDVKTITTYFTSHQSDTQQKTGKMVSRATFLPNGELDELVNKTTYPYDSEYETKREFWQQPIKKNLPYIMDGLGMGVAENNLLYGNNWPAANAKLLLRQETREERRLPWKQTFEIDNMDRPTEIKTINLPDTTGGKFVSLFNPNSTTFYEYKEGKVSEIFVSFTYPELKRNNQLQERLDELAKKSPGWQEMQSMRNQSGKKKKTTAYTYDGDLLTSITFQGFQKTERSYRFYYEGEVLTKSEYYITGTLINTRIHYYENGLKERTEIFNVDNEPEYTINYEYEFWE